jgi:hypothetical protein
MNRLKMIALAMHNYLDFTGAFPPAHQCDKNGKPLLSWRVLILPYIEQDNLYRQFHLNEPWDSEHNRQLISQMPDLYKSSRKLAAEGKTTILGVAGEHAMFTGCKGLAIRDVTDGTSNTIWFVDASDSRAVVWTKPEDLNYDPRDPLAGLVGHFPQGFAAAFVDGSARFISKKVDANLLNALFTRNGGEVIGEVP